MVPLMTSNPCRMQLTDLPPEMQLMILEVDPKTLPRMAQVNHWFHDLTYHAIARHFGDQPISTGEFEAHLTTQPRVIGKLTLHKRRESIPGYADDYRFNLIYGITPDVFIGMNSDVKVNSYGVDVSLLNHPEMASTVTEILRERAHINVDLLTQYLILSRRRQCIDWAQKKGQGLHYVRDVVLTVLGKIYDLTQSNRVGETLGVYMYLLMHAIILRTPTIPPREHSRDLNLLIDREGYLNQATSSETELKIYQDIRTTLPIMYREIRDHLMTL
jgi:hypothetical protein